MKSLLNKIGLKKNRVLKDSSFSTLESQRATRRNSSLYTLYFILFFILLTLNSPVAHALSFPSNNLGLVGYWSFEDASGTQVTDGSGNGNTGTLTNMESGDWINGKRGKALDFGGTDEYVNIPNHASLNPDYITVAAWIKKSTTGTYGQIIDKDTTSGNRVWQFRVKNTDVVQFIPFSAASNGDCSGSVVVADGNWHHVVGTWDGTTIYIYVDGVVDGAGCSFSGSLRTGQTNPVAIGSLSFAQGNWLVGQVDEARIYNRAISATEVAALYGAGSVKVTTNTTNGLIGYWSMEDATGTQATDFSGNGNNGTLTNSPIWTNGARGKGMTFDGTVANPLGTLTGISRLLVGQDLGSSTAISASFWIKPTGGQKGGIMTSGPTLSVPRFAISINADNSIEGYRGSTFQGGGALTAGVWSHVVVTHSGSDFTIYYNGAQAATGSNTVTEATQSTFIIGANYWGSVPGSLDEVRIYDRVLTAAEVTALYSSGSVRVNAPDNRGLMGYWSFEDATGTQATDFSGNNAPITLNNGVTFQNGVRGKSTRFVSSSAHSGSATANWSGTDKITLSFWMKWDGYANNDRLAFETGSPNSFGTNGIFVDPNESGSGVFVFGFTKTGGVIWWDSFTRPSAGVWHHYVLEMDRGNNVNYAWVDGVAQSLSAYIQNAGTYGNFSDDTLYFMSRAGSSLYGGGNLDEVRVYNRLLSAQEVLALYNTAR